MTLVNGVYSVSVTLSPLRGPRDLSNTGSQCAPIPIAAFAGTLAILTVGSTHSGHHGSSRRTNCEVP